MATRAPITGAPTRTRYDKPVPAIPPRAFAEQIEQYLAKTGMPVAPSV